MHENFGAHLLLSLSEYVQLAPSDGVDLANLGKMGPWERLWSSQGVWLECLTMLVCDSGVGTCARVKQKGWHLGTRLVTNPI